VELLLVRHGEMEVDPVRHLGDPPLAEAGRSQARALAERLRALHFDLCLVSPLVRAQETARLLVEGRAIPTETHACLAEGASGALDGLPRDEATRSHAEFYRLGRTVLARLAASGSTAPGGETRAEFLARARAAQALVTPPLFHPSARVLVVSHGGLLAYLIQLLLGHEPRDEATIGFDFCGVARVTAYREDPAFGPFAMLRFVPS
jgi:broad specificity phosphatase PhoE